MDRRCPLGGELSDYITMDDSGYRALRVTTSKHVRIFSSRINVVATITGKCFRNFHPDPTIHIFLQ